MPSLELIPFEKRSTAANIVLAKAGVNTLVIRTSNGARLRQYFSVGRKFTTTMTVQLIPVLEIKLNKSDAGILSLETLMPYFEGLNFYRISELTELNLGEIVANHTAALRNAEYGREGASALFGGYVLKVNEVDVYFPQCCGDLSDIRYWEQLVMRKYPIQNNGHPGPIVVIKKDEIKFDFAIGEDEEKFEPELRQNSVNISKEELRVAINNAMVELLNLAQKLNKINDERSFGIEDIDKLLIWGDS